MNAATATTATGDRLAVRRCRLSGLSHWHPPTCHTVTLTPGSRTVPMMVEHWATEIAAHRRADVIIRVQHEYVLDALDTDREVSRTCFGCGDPMPQGGLLCRDCMQDLRDGDITVVGERNTVIGTG